MGRGVVSIPTVVRVDIFTTRAREKDCVTRPVHLQAVRGKTNKKSSFENNFPNQERSWAHQFQRNSKVKAKFSVSRKKQNTACENPLRCIYYSGPFC